MQTLDNTILEEYQKICHEADALLEDNNYEKALIRFEEALNRLPDGIWNCEAYAYAGKGEAFQALEKWEEAFQAFMWIYVNDQTENPYVLMNLGICYYHLDNLQKAKEFLLEAYKLDGEDVFDGAEQYLDIIRPFIA